MATGPVESAGIVCDDMHARELVHIVSRSRNAKSLKPNFKKHQGIESTSHGLNYQGKPSRPRSSTRSKSMTMLTSGMLTAVIFYADVLFGGEVPKFNLSYLWQEPLLALLIVIALLLVMCFKMSSSQQKGLGGRKASSCHTNNKGTRHCPGSTAQLNHAIAQMAMKGLARRAGELLRTSELKGWVTNVWSYNMVIRSHSRRGEVMQAEQWLEQMQAKGIKANEYSYYYILLAYSKNTDLLSIEEWIQRMDNDGVLPSSRIYKVVIRTAAKLGNLERGEHWLKAMLHQGLQPEACSYTDLIHACSLQCNLEEAEKWFQEMQSKSLQPCIMTYVALLDACTQCLDMDKAGKWMEEMLTGGLQPPGTTCSALVDACAKVGDLSQAEQWYGRFRARGVQLNVQSFSRLINASTQLGDVDAACSWLRRAEDANITLDASTYTCLVSVCGKANNAERALSVFGQMCTQGIQSHIKVYGALAHPFAIRGDWVSVERIAKRMIGEGIKIDERFFYALLFAYARASPPEVQRAETAFTQALAVGFHTSHRALRALACAIGKARYEELVEELVCSYDIPDVVINFVPEADVDATSLAI